LVAIALIVTFSVAAAADCGAANEALDARTTTIKTMLEALRASD